jgi:hypothetical protein
MSGHLIVKKGLRIFTLHPLKPMADAFPQKTNRALGASKALTDFSRRVTLQAQFKNRAFFFVQVGQELLDRFAEHGGFDRSGLAAERIEPRRRPISLRQRNFPREVPALGAMIGSPFSTFAHGDQSEQTPKAVPVHHIQVSTAIAAKETLVHRLNDVFGIHLMSQPGADVPLGQSDELMGKARKELSGRGVILAMQSSQEFSE